MAFVQHHSITLEQFIEETSGNDDNRLGSDLIRKDLELVFSYKDTDSGYISEQTAEEQFFFALLILEAEGR